jgi:hypothetical protein
MSLHSTHYHYEKNNKNVTLKYVSQEKKTCIVYTMYSVVGQDLHLNGPLQAKY